MIGTEYRFGLHSITFFVIFKQMSIEDGCFELKICEMKLANWSGFMKFLSSSLSNRERTLSITSSVLDRNCELMVV